MSDAPRLTPARRDAQAARAERLARALRENLHRRKDQARSRATGAAEPPRAMADDGEPPA
jgi:hypothetical protein